MATSKSKRAGSVRSGAGRNRSANPRGVPKANYPFFPQELVERMSQDLHLKNDLEYAYGSLRVALSGVKFFYSVTCKRPWNIFAMLKLQNVHTLPEVITIDADSVTYDYVPSKTHAVKSRTVTGRQFVEGLTQHILPSGLRKVRYHG
jgi:hypothetical protein